MLHILFSGRWNSWWKKFQLQRNVSPSLRSLSSPGNPCIADCLYNSCFSYRTNGRKGIIIHCWPISSLLWNSTWKFSRLLLLNHAENSMYIVLNSWPHGSYLFFLSNEQTRNILRRKFRNVRRLILFKIKSHSGKEKLPFQRLYISCLETLKPLSKQEEWPGRQVGRRSNLRFVGRPVRSHDWSVSWSEHRIR